MDGYDAQKDDSIRARSHEERRGSERKQPTLIIVVDPSAGSPRCENARIGDDERASLVSPSMRTPPRAVFAPSGTATWSPCRKFDMDVVDPSARRTCASAGKQPGMFTSNRGGGDVGGGGGRASDSGAPGGGGNGGGGGSRTSHSTEHRALKVAAPSAQSGLESPDSRVYVTVPTPAKSRDDAYIVFVDAEGIAFCAVHNTSDGAMIDTQSQSIEFVRKQGRRREQHQHHIYIISVV